MIIFGPYLERIWTVLITHGQPYVEAMRASVAALHGDQESLVGLLWGSLIRAPSLLERVAKVVGYESSVQQIWAFLMFWIVRVAA